MSQWSPIWTSAWGNVWSSIWSGIRLCDISKYFYNDVETTVNFDGLVPDTGDIYSGTTLIGNRDPITKEFTPDAATPAAFLVSDTPCLDNPLLTHNEIAVTLNGAFVTHTA